LHPRPVTSDCSPNNWGCIGPSRSGAALIGGIALGVAGGLIGTIIGGRTSHETRYLFGPAAR
jgi:hypothetical protein